MYFASDNWTGASDPVAAAVAGIDRSVPAAAYGTDDLTAEAIAALGARFETDIECAFVATGTAANILSAAVMARPGGLYLTHRGAHVAVDELGGAEALAPGFRTYRLDGPNGKITEQALRHALDELPDGNRFGRPVALSLTQATELGTVYSVEEVSTLAAIAHEAGMLVHMDGARFANAVAAQGCSPAELTWRAGVDLMSFGATKNGCWCAEAMISFRPDLFRDLQIFRIRTGQVLSKSRFVATQLLAYLKDDHWLDLAGHANSMAARLADGLAESNLVSLDWRPDGNEVFVTMSDELVASLTERGAVFHTWPVGDLMPDEKPARGFSLARFVTSFATTNEDVDGLLSLIAESETSMQKAG
ncbi:threonine aldolase family protein [Coralliovum pocilloporae]|uniref:threonine aldolase family protein n=1 Tax=Coralliovum pocilloporae TaxID=3066369 RepID=UPI0033076DA6